MKKRIKILVTGLLSVFLVYLFFTPNLQEDKPVDKRSVNPLKPSNVLFQSNEIDEVERESITSQELKRNVDRLNTAEMTIDLQYEYNGVQYINKQNEKDFEEFRFMDDTILVGMLPVLDIYTHLISEEFGISFSERLGILVEGDEIELEEDKGIVKSIHVPGVSTVLTDNGEIDATEATYSESESGEFMITADSLTFHGNESKIQQGASLNASKPRE